MYRISEKALKSQNALCWWKAIFYALMTVGIYCTLVLIFGHTIVLPNNTDLSTCFKNQNLQLSNDSIYMVGEGELSREELDLIKSENKTIWNSS